MVAIRTFLGAFADAAAPDADLSLSALPIRAPAPGLPHALALVVVPAWFLSFNARLEFAS